MSSISTAVISLVAAAGLAGALAELPGGEAVRMPEVPLAALAWTQLHCGLQLSAREGTPRVPFEDFMRITATYDAIQNAEGVQVACDQALASARRVAQAATINP